MEPLGLYISVPFCKAKCTFCNFASDAFGPARMQAYTERLCHEIAAAQGLATALGAGLPKRADTVYLGGGTPSLLEASQIRLIFETLRSTFHVEHDAEITLECAPGQLAGETLAELLRQGMNRVSLGVQSFVDAESSAVGRLHTRATCLAEIARIRAAGIADIGVDLIVGLPGQTEASWRYSVEEAIATGATHVSVYMLEVDEESRLGREALRGGSRYGAASLPPDEAVADWYLLACELLAAARIAQYEISNFARPGFASRHNQKYWRRAPYLGFGLDAHSMLRTASGAVRWANRDQLDGYLAAGPFALLSAAPERIGPQAAFEEALFLGLRMNAGLSFAALLQDHGETLLSEVVPRIAELAGGGFLQRQDARVALTAKGRLVSNEVFERLLITAGASIPAIACTSVETARGRGSSFRIR